MREKVPWEDLERVTGIKRNTPPSFTQADAERLERKKLPKWGRRRPKK